MKRLVTFIGLILLVATGAQAALHVGDEVKFDQAVSPHTYSNNSATGNYFSMGKWRTATILVEGGALAATKTTSCTIYQATSSAGAGAKAIVLATAVFTANTNASEMTIAMSSTTDTATLVINGLTFSAHASVTSEALRQFSTSGDNTADADELAACINDPVYGVPGVTATAVTGTITLNAVPYGEKTITVVSTSSGITLATTAYQMAVNISTNNMDTANSFNHIAAKLASTGSGIAGAALLRGGGRFLPQQYLGAVYP